MTTGKADGSSRGSVPAEATADAGKRPSEGSVLAGTVVKATAGDTTAAPTSSSSTPPPTTTLEEITEKMEQMEDDLTKCDITDDENTHIPESKGVGRH